MPCAPLSKSDVESLHLKYIPSDTDSILKN